jgi:rubrerythrin
MQISEAISTIRAELIFKKTPTGRPINEFALENLRATIQDEKNWQSNVIICKNCCIIMSSLLMPEGCPNCGLKQDLNRNISKADLL